MKPTCFGWTAAPVLLLLLLALVGRDTHAFQQKTTIDLVLGQRPFPTMQRNGQGHASLNKHHRHVSRHVSIIWPPPPPPTTTTTNTNPGRRGCSHGSATSSSSSSTALGSTGAPWLDMTVATASVAATAKLLSAIGLGGLAASKPGLLDAAAISALSRLTYWVFQPAFLFCSVSKTIYTAFTSTGAGTLPLRALWLLPALGVAQILTGAVVGRFLATAYGVSDDEVPNVRMCTTFANSGPLPLIFADALFGSNPVLQSQMAA
eukprot:scaffold43448_cov199-Amphora_coffeaeformis.AAC.1